MAGYELVSHLSRESPYGGSCVFAVPEADMEDVPQALELSRKGHIVISTAVSHKLKIIVVGIYRSPSGNTEIFLDNLGCVWERLANYTEYKATNMWGLYYQFRSELSIS
ncbi:hypothetical protein HHI36_004250 [Cryptolaemus montrouzieri]|uniref:Uncharacterized protein n=1 Tax=Cryptolaemus montrouzieri TaxID=559131 RepID=A0ABD2NQV2_9CUCU